MVMAAWRWRDVFKTLSNINGRDFWKNSKLLQAVKYFLILTRTIPYIKFQQQPLKMPLKKSAIKILQTHRKLLRKTLLLVQLLFSELQT